MPVKKCCKYYPKCEHYKNWDEPAKQIDPEHSDTFHDVMIEATQPILRSGRIHDFAETISSLKEYLQILPVSLQPLYVDKIIHFITPYYKQDMIRTLDYKRIQKELANSLPANKNEQKKEKKSKKLTFGFNGNPAKLNSILQQLQLKIDLLNEIECSIDDLMDVLLSKDLSDKNKRIELSCETTQFAYVLKKIEQHFRSPMQTTVESYGNFYSKRNIRITANSLYQATSKSPSPKQNVEIEKIFSNTPFC